MTYNVGWSHVSKTIVWSASPGKHLDYLVWSQIFFSSYTITYVMHPNTHICAIQGFFPLHISLGVMNGRALVGQRLRMWTTFAIFSIQNVLLRLWAWSIPFAISTVLRIVCSTTPLCCGLYNVGVCFSILWSFKRQYNYSKKFYHHYMIERPRFYAPIVPLQGMYSPYTSPSTFHWNSTCTSTRFWKIFNKGDKIPCTAHRCKSFWVHTSKCIIAHIQ